MENKLATWSFIAKQLQTQVSVMLLYVVQSAGSSPGRQGFFMAVNSHGEMEGSMGGGIMEHKFVEKAKAILQGEQLEAVIQKQIHNKTASKNQSGMICSGEQTILLYVVQPADLTSILSIENWLTNYQSGLLTLKPSGIAWSDRVDTRTLGFTHLNSNDWLYSEVIGYQNKLYIIGGGHCSLALSKLMRDLDFYILLFDDREALHTMDKNVYVHQKKILKDYSELENIIEDGNNIYVIIMTFGYRTDDVALRALMYKKVKYIGVLGSAKKIEKMFNAYKAEGISEDILNRIHAPIGMPIKSQTPEEIAVSIAAEVIQVKNASLV